MGWAAAACWVLVAAVLVSGCGPRSARLAAGATSRTTSTTAATSSFSPVATADQAPSPTPTDSPAPPPTPTPNATPPPVVIAAWQPQRMPATAGGSMGLTCTDSRHCWAVGEDPTGFAPQILATTDGGNVWTAQTVPDTPARLQAVFDVSCLSTHFCVAVAGTYPGETTSVILRTVDGGSTWTQVALPADGQSGLARLECVGTSVCYALGQDQNRKANVLDITADGGTTWTATSAPDGVCSLAANCFLRGLSFVDARRGWLVGGGLCPGNGCTGVVEATTDGGATWRSQFTGSGAITDISCVRDASTVDCHSVGVAPSGSLVSRDGGTSWSQQPTPQYAASIDCADALHCRAVGARDQSTPVPSEQFPQVGLLVTTSDGGSSWATESLAPGTSTWLNRVFCVDPLSCWAVGAQRSGGATLALVLATTSRSGR